MISGTVEIDCSGEAHRVSYRCPETKNIILFDGRLETRRCTVCCRKGRSALHQKCKFNCEARFDAMIPKDQGCTALQTESFINRYVRALCTGAMRVGVT